MCKTWRLYKVFYLVCSHACVLALARFEYSEDLKVSPQEVWLTWWNFSTVICSFKNLFVSRFRPYSFVLQIRVRKSRISTFSTQKISDRVRKSGHRTFYNILHKQDKMAYTVPRFDPYIYLFAKQKNNEEGKRDISSWRGNVVQMWWRKKGEW